MSIRVHSWLLPLLLLTTPLTLPSCSPTQKQELIPPVPDSAIATVGTTPIALETIQSVAARDGLNLYEESARDKALTEAINFEILATEAESAGYFDDPEITRMVKKMAVGKLLRDRLDNPTSDTPKPTEAELHDYYKSHTEDFSQPALLKAQFLLIHNGDEAESKIAAVQDAISANTTPFGNLVATHASDPAARSNGGMSNWIIQGGNNKRYPSEIIAALFAADPDTIVGPITSPQGTWFAKLAEKRPGRATPFNEARPRITQEITRARRQAAYEELVTTLRATADIQQFPDRIKAALDASPTPSGPPPGPPGT